MSFFTGPSWRSQSSTRSPLWATTEGAYETPEKPARKRIKMLHPRSPGAWLICIIDVKHEALHRIGRISQS